MRFLSIIFTIFGAGFCKAPLDVFIVSDFTQDFVLPNSLSLSSSVPFICPSSAYPNALHQFQFTSDVIAGVQKTIPMNTHYYAYAGGDGESVGNIPVASRENFTEAAVPEYLKFCKEGPRVNGFERFIKLTITPSLTTDLLIIFTAASTDVVNRALPIATSNIKKIIVLGLNGTLVSKPYPKSSITLSDFSRPEVVSCMIDELYETIHGKVSDVDAAAICNIAPTVPTTTTQETTTQPIPISRILVINDFTAEYMQNDISRSKATSLNVSNSIKCVGGMWSSASDQFDFSNNFIQGIDMNIPLDLYYYAFNGDWHPIDTTSFLTRDTFPSGTEFKNVVCLEEDFLPNDLPRLMDVIASSDVVFDMIVMLTAASAQELDAVLPMTFFPAPVITVGLRGASAFNDYPTTSTVIKDFNHPELITCMIEAVIAGHPDPANSCSYLRPPMSILIVNDFTLDYVGEDYIMSRKQNVNHDKVLPHSQADTYGKCPGGMYPKAGLEFNFTVDVVNAVRQDVDMSLTFYEYTGGYGYGIDDTSTFTRDNFAFGATAVLRDACLSSYPQPSDLERFAFETLSSVSTDVLILFTAVSLDSPIQMLYNQFRVIVIGVEGAQVSSAYPQSSISIDDFSHPESVACMIGKLWDNLQSEDLLYCQQ